LNVQRVVDCRGPGTDYARLPDPLIRQLLADGLARPDPCRLGLEATQQGSLVGAGGRPTPYLFGVGPVTRGTFWEITSVPDIRAQAEQVATNALASVRWRRGKQGGVGAAPAAAARRRGTASVQPRQPPPEGGEASRLQVRLAFYNRPRRHSAIGFWTPPRAYEQVAWAAHPPYAPVHTAGAGSQPQQAARVVMPVAATGLREAINSGGARGPASGELDVAGHLGRLAEAAVAAGALGVAVDPPSADAGGSGVVHLGAVAAVAATAGTGYRLRFRLGEGGLGTGGQGAQAGAGSPAAPSLGRAAHSWSTSPPPSVATSTNRTSPPVPTRQA
jgi:hypothetical protein